MSAARKKGEYPDLRAEDVLTGGTLTLWRNPAGKRFRDRDEWTIEESWRAPHDIHDAYAKAAKKEARLASCQPLAWDSEFGYLSPFPLHCGTGMEIEGMFHLEALNLIGDLPPVLNAIQAVRFRSSSIAEDGIRQAAHLFRVANNATLGISEGSLIKKATTLFNDLTAQENNARRALVEELPRVLEDSISRALAILRCCRLLAPGELLDLLSPVCLGATMGFIDGITRAEAIKMMRSQMDEPPIVSQSSEDDRRRDARDADLADRINRRFRKVKFSDYAEECLG